MLNTSLLSLQERRVLDLASQGLEDKEIADKLSVSLTSIRTYWDRLRTKLGAINRLHAIALARPYLLEMERELSRHIEEVNRYIIQAISEVAIFRIGVDGLIKTWNQGVKDVLGYDEDEWINLSHHVVFIPKDVFSGDPEEEFISADLLGSSVIDRWHMRKDGSRFWGRNSVIPFRPVLEAPGFAKIVQDRSWEAPEARDLRCPTALS